MTTYRFNIQLDAEQSFEFVKALLPRRSDLFAYWDSLGQPGYYGHIPIDAEDFFDRLELWSVGEPLQFSISSGLGRSLHEWAEKELKSADGKVEVGSNSNPEKDPAFRGLKLIQDYMRLSSPWFELNSTNSFRRGFRKKGNE